MLTAKTLKIFFINNAGLGPEGNKKIAESFIGCPNLEVYSSTRNRAENMGAIAYSENLKYLKNLKEFYIT